VYQSTSWPTGKDAVWVGTATLTGQLVIVRMKGRQTILGGCCARCMLYSVYAVLSVCCTRCMLYSVYAVLGVSCTQFMPMFPPDRTGPVWGRAQSGPVPPEGRTGPGPRLAVLDWMSVVWNSPNRI